MPYSWKPHKIDQSLFFVGKEDGHFKCSPESHKEDNVQTSWLISSYCTQKLLLKTMYTICLYEVYCMDESLNHTTLLLSS